ncbi:MAG: Glyoxalase/bleomycin resistance protein/dioxygenase [Cyanobacteria bacterium RYN_339]|nr:Glyoxalase/bleomycin resistance protein/dioxygenase [Cyanobacteria bacterium RYN_339]
MQVKGVDFVGIAVSDIDAAKAFYGDALGLPCTGGFGDRWVEYDAGNVTLALILGDAEAIAKRLEPGPFAAIGVALGVADLEATVAALEQRGVTITMPPKEFPPCFTAMVQDPSGNHVWLHQRKDGTAG